MRRQLIIVLAALFTVQSAATYAMSPFAPGTVSASGIIDTEKSIVPAPRIWMPTIVTRLNSFSKAPGMGSAAISAAVKASVEATALRSGSAPWMPSMSQLAANPVAPAGIIERLYVKDGQRVAKGQPLAEIDPTLLHLAVRRNDAAASQARAQLLVVNQHIAELEYKRRQIKDAQAKLEEGKAALATARGKLATGEAKLNAAESKLRAELDKLSHIKIPPMPIPPPPSPTPSPSGTPPPPPGPRPPIPPIPPIARIKAKLLAGLAQLAAARAQLAAGAQMLQTQTAKLAQAEVQLAKAEDQIGKARVKLDLARKLATINIRRTKISAHASRTELKKTRIVAPRDGVVTDLAVHAGELAFSNQPLMTVAETKRVTLRLYLPPDEVRLTKTGLPADVFIDTYPSRAFPAKVGLIAPEVQFAPSNVATTRTYLSYVQAVTVNLDNPDGILKPGMPADAEIGLR